VIAATGGIVSARAAMKATSSIPILFISGVDPRTAGLVDDLAYPSGNASGVNVRTTELMFEGLKYLRKMAGNPDKVAVLVNPRNFVAAMESDQARNDNLIVLTATNEAELTAELTAALASAVDQGASALLIAADPALTTQRNLIIQFASDQKIPTAYPWSTCVSAGGVQLWYESI
jgi:putative ABC transport system substrate-binding protein